MRLKMKMRSFSILIDFINKYFIINQNSVENLHMLVGHLTLFRRECSITSSIYSSVICFFKQYIPAN